MNRRKSGVEVRIYWGGSIKKHKKTKPRTQKDNEVEGTKTKQRPQAGVQRLQLQFGSSQEDNAVRGFPSFTTAETFVCIFHFAKNPMF